VLPTGGVACWGYNSDGQLGDGTFGERTVPYTIASLSNVTWIATGQHASCAVKADHTVYCWGNGFAGAPVAVMDGFGHTFDSAKSVAVGATHKCLITTTDEVQCWGSNTNGQLGDGGSTSSTVPKTIGMFNSGLYDAAEVVAAAFHTCVRKNSGVVECWGLNSGGSIGNSGSDSLAPVTIVGLSGVTSIATNEMSTCAALADGSVKCWGTFVGLGSDTATVSNVPVAIPGLSNVIALSGGGGSYCALQDNNRIRCWGYMGTVDKTNVPRLENIDNVTAVALGSGHTCALQTTGLMDCWGSNTNGQLGLGHKVSINSGPNPPVTTVTSDPFVVTPVTFWH
jgi:alpha-tubulin suppressor-like RCC1 family protein